MTTPLERRYRRLLLAYPSTYRAYRGEEIVSTLCDGARPRQRFPRPVETLDLVAGGLRERLGGPAGTAFADGLRIALPVTLVLTAAVAASVHVDQSGPVGAPFLQPYVYAWAAALAAWAFAPGLAPIAIPLATLVTIRVAVMWSWKTPETQLVCVLALLASYVALAAPPHSTTVDRRGSAAALWSLPGRVATMAVAAVLGALGAISQPMGASVLFSLTCVPLVLAIVGVAARLRGRSGPLWAAVVLAPVPAAWFLMYLGSLPWAWASFGPTLPNRDVDGTLIDFAFPVTLAAAGLIAYRSGRPGLLAASRVLTVASLATVAASLITLEVLGGLPWLAAFVGGAVLAIAGLSAAVVPRPVSWALLGLGAAAVLSDVAGGHGRPWPLAALVLLALLAALQAPARWPGPWLAAVGWIVAALVVGGGYVFEAWRPYRGLYPYALTSGESAASALALPAFALAVVAAIAGARLRPVRATFMAFVGLAGLLAFAAPVDAVAVIGGVSAAGAVLTALAARHGQPAPS